VANLNNPAGRLLFWLELGKQRPQGNSAMGEWCAVFGLDQSSPAERAECTRRGTMLARLARDVRREAEQLPDHFHPAMLLSAFPEVEGALDQFTVLPNVTMAQMYSLIQGTGWQSLQYLDAMLSTHRPETVVEHDAIRGHIESVRALVDDILADDDLDAAVKRYVVARLRDVEEALTDALIVGVDGVELAVNATIGSAQMDRDWWDRIAKTKWAPRIGAVWMAMVTSLGAVGGVPALMPGDEPQPPAIVQTVEVDTNTDVTLNVEDEDIHDAEVVDEDKGGPREVAR
jgi:hypothetical protein